MPQRVLCSDAQQNFDDGLATGSPTLWTETPLPDKSGHLSIIIMILNMYGYQYCICIIDMIIDIIYVLSSYGSDGGLATGSPALAAPETPLPDKSGHLSSAATCLLLDYFY